MFPDAELPPRGDGSDLHGHGSFMILNSGTQSASILCTFWFTDREPDQFLIEVPPHRVRCLRTENPDDMAGRRPVVGE